MGKCSVQMGVRDLLDAEHIKHLVVSLGLEALELVNRNMAVVNRDKVQQLAVLLDVDLELLDIGGVGINILLDRVL